MPRKNWHSLPEYEALRAVMEGDTTASAARRLGLSQSAVSRSISSLEGRIGRSLFERAGGRLKPTMAAVELNARLDPLFEALDALDRPTEQSDNSLRIMAPPSFANRFLTGHVASFLHTRPEYFLSLEIGTSEAVISGVQDNRYDIGIVGIEMTRNGVKLIPFLRAQAACVMAPGHALTKCETVHPQDLDQQKFVAFISRHARRAQLDKVLLEANASPRFVAEVSTSGAAIDLVRAGLGIAVVNPFPAVQESRGDLEFRRFSSPISFQVYFVVPDNRPLSRVARHFMQHVRLHTPRDDFSHPIRSA